MKRYQPYQVHFLLSCLLVVSVMSLAGCGPKQARAPVVGPFTTEQIARGVLEQFTAFLKQAQVNHPECSADKPTSKQGICPALHGGIAGQNTLIGAIHVYCNGAPLASDKPYTDGGPCSPVIAQEPNLQNVLSQVLNYMVQYANFVKKGGQ